MLQMQVSLQETGRKTRIKFSGLSGACWPCNCWGASSRGEGLGAPWPRVANPWPAPERVGAGLMAAPGVAALQHRLVLQLCFHQLGLWGAKRRGCEGQAVVAFPAGLCEDPVRGWECGREPLEAPPGAAVAAERPRDGPHSDPASLGVKIGSAEGKGEVIQPSTPFP